MKLKINRYEFDVSNKDWILDNGVCYQCMTLTHRVYETKYHIGRNIATEMSKAQFKQLVKEGKLIDITEAYQQKYPNRYPGCKIWKFNVEN